MGSTYHMPGALIHRDTFTHVTHLILKIALGKDNSIIIPILQMRKLRPRQQSTGSKVTELALMLTRGGVLDGQRLPLGVSSSLRDSVS